MNFSIWCIVRCDMLEYDFNSVVMAWRESEDDARRYVDLLQDENDTALKFLNRIYDHDYSDRARALLTGTMMDKTVIPHMTVHYLTLEVPWSIPDLSPSHKEENLAMLTADERSLVDSLDFRQMLEHLRSEETDDQLASEMQDEEDSWK